MGWHVEILWIQHSAILFRHPAYHTAITASGRLLCNGVRVALPLGGPSLCAIVLVQLLYNGLAQTRDTSSCYDSTALGPASTRQMRKTSDSGVEPDTTYRTDSIARDIEAHIAQNLMF